MRKRKFRAWIKSVKQWQTKENVRWTPIGELMGIGNVNDYEWVEFTGFLDKNGREIWEGDIVRYRDYLYEIKWNTYNSSFGLHEKEYFIHSLFSDEQQNFEVIGNIWENSELIGRNG